MQGFLKICQRLERADGSATAGPLGEDFGGLIMRLEAVRQALGPIISALPDAVPVDSDGKQRFRVGGRSSGYTWALSFVITLLFYLLYQYFQIEIWGPGLESLHSSGGGGGGGGSSGGGGAGVQARSQ